MPSSIIWFPTGRSHPPHSTHHCSRDSNLLYMFSVNPIPVVLLRKAEERHFLGCGGCERLDKGVVWGVGNLGRRYVDG